LEGRFKATILPELAIAACTVYVDPGPVRAGIAATPEASDFTSAQERIADLKSADEVSTADAKDARIEHGESAGWLAPVELEPKRKKVREKCTSRRASNKGCVFMSLAKYLELLDWTGRQVKPGKRCHPAYSSPPASCRRNAGLTTTALSSQTFGPLAQGQWGRWTAGEFIAHCKPSLRIWPECDKLSRQDAATAIRHDVLTRNN